MQVSAIAKKIDKSATVEFNFGESLEEAVELFGAEVVFSSFKKAQVVSLQSAMRKKLEAGVEADLVSEALFSPAEGVAWKPGVARVRAGKSVQAKAIEEFGAMSEADQNAFIMNLKARLKSNQANTEAG